MPNILKKLTFGLEIEIVKLSPQAAGLIAKHSFGSHYDRTIRGRNNEVLPASVEDGGGVELITVPLEVSVACSPDGAGLQIEYGQTAEVVRDLCACAAEVNLSCGVHVHLGRPDSAGKSRWEPERVRTALLIGMMLEQRLFELCPSSRRGNQYCKPILESYSAGDICKFYPMGDVQPRKYDNPKRYCWLNTIETRRPDRSSSPATGTLEIRMMGNVRRYDYIWAWTKLWLQVAAYVAYVPTSLAIAHCVQSGSLEAAFKELEAAKAIDRKKTLLKPAARPADNRRPVTPPVDRQTLEDVLRATTVDNSTDDDDGPIAPPSPVPAEYEQWSRETGRYYATGSTTGRSSNNS